MERTSSTALDFRHYNHKELRELRRKTRLSARALAKTLGVKTDKVARAERGEVVTYDFLCRLAQYYDRPVTYFLYQYPRVA
jgi:transcriptional regulator with XRE-family HTH domain